MLQLRINGENADISPQGSVDLTLISPHLTYESLFTSSAKLPTLPLTPKNRRLFGFSDLLQVASNQERRIVQQYYNGHLIQEGVGLATSDESGFSLSVVQPLGEFFGDYQTLPLSQIDLGTIPVPSPLPPVLQVGGQDAVCFPTVLNAGFYGTSGPSIGYSGRVNDYAAGGYTAAGPLVPLVFVKWLLQRIAALTGTTITGTLLDHPALSKLVLYNTRALDGASAVTVRNHLPEMTIGQLLLEIRKVFNLAYDFNAVAGTLKTSLTDDIFLAAAGLDWSRKAAKAYKKRPELNRRLQLAYELDNGDVLQKDKPAILADYLTPGNDEETGIAKVSCKLSTLLIDGVTGLPMAEQAGITVQFSQLANTYQPRLLFWRGMENGLPLAGPQLGGFSLYWNGPSGLAAQFWKATEAFRTQMFYVERGLVLSETDLATWDFKRKIHIDGVNYLVAQASLSLPVRQPAQALLIRA